MWHHGHKKGYPIAARDGGAVVAQSDSARLSEREIPGSILGDLKRLFRLSSDPCSCSFKYP